MATRLEAKYENHCERFILEAFDYQKQFCHLYSHRLKEMTELLVPEVQKAWGTAYSIKKIFELNKDEDKSCVVIGTIYKHQAHKPSILRDLAAANEMAPQPQRLHYSDPEDKLILEDELQRVRLQGNVDLEHMATGVVCAVLGNIEDDGRFVVEKTLFYEGGPQKPLQLRAQKQERCLVLLSDLNAMETHNFVDALNLLQLWLLGHISTAKQHSNQLVRVIVAGNSVSSIADDTKKKDATDAKIAVEAMKRLDTWFDAWCQSIPIDVMPGANDPANFMLPQQPFHPCLFPLAATNAAFRCVTNPYECKIDDVLITGCSGQNVNDLLRCTTIDNALTALGSTLTWSHIAPTAPDTLACYPYIKNDPFVLKQRPHIYFAGNCAKFETELATASDGKRSTRLICVPSFAKTRQVVVVNIETLDCQAICFDALHEQQNE